MSVDRRAVRVLAMQTLCQWDVQHDESVEAGSALADAVEAPRKVAGQALELTQAFWKDRATIDERIAAVAQHWDLQRLSLVDRNVLRVAVTEMVSGTVPPKVAIDEAIEIVKEFGGVDSPRFVNGVLDAVLRKIEDEIGAAPTKRGTTSEEERL